MNKGSANLYELSHNFSDKLLDNYGRYISYILFRLLYLAFILALVSSSANTVSAQHKIDPEAWVEMRKMLWKKGPAPTIEEDIATLAGPDFKRAGPRLIDHGSEALPAIHAAIRSPDIEPRHAQKLLQLLRYIGDESSVPVVLELLGRDEKFLLRRDALLVLAHLPSTEEAASFIIHLANDDNEKWFTRRMAFTWFGFHRDPRGRRYAEPLCTDPDMEKQTAGLYVLARLGDTSVLEPITQLLIAPRQIHVMPSCMLWQKSPPLRNLNAVRHPPWPGATAIRTLCSIRAILQQKQKKRSPSVNRCFARTPLITWELESAACLKMVTPMT